MVRASMDEMWQNYYCTKKTDLEKKNAGNIYMIRGIGRHFDKPLRAGKGS